MRMAGAGLAVELPDGWEAAIDGGDGAWRGIDEIPGSEGPGEPGATTRPDGSVRRLVAQFANFPLPAERGDYGDGAIEAMRSGDILIVILEFDPASAETALFASEGVPRSLRAAEFDRDALHVPRFGATGAQRFFTVNGRAFAMYVVMGSHIDRADDIPKLNEILASLELS